MNVWLPAGVLHGTGPNLPCLPCSPSVPLVREDAMAPPPAVAVKAIHLLVPTCVKALPARGSARWALRLAAGMPELPVSWSDLWQSVKDFN